MIDGSEIRGNERTSYDPDDAREVFLSAEKSAEEAEEKKRAAWDAWEAADQAIEEIVRAMSSEDVLAGTEALDAAQAVEEAAWVEWLKAADEAESAAWVEYEAAHILRDAEEACQDGVVIRSLEGLKVEPVRWEVPGRIPKGKLVLIAGDGGAGKSTLIRHLMGCMSAGKPAFGLQYKTTPGSVLFFAGEDGIKDVVLPSIISEGGNVSRILDIPYVRIVETTGKGKTISKVHFGLDHLHLLRKKLKSYPDIRLIVIDPIASFIGRARIDDHKQADLRRVLDPLNELAEQTGITIILIAHVNKSSGEKAVYRIAGSASYANGVRLAYLTSPDPDDDTKRLMMPVKQNILGIEPSALVFRLHSLARDERDVCREHPAMRHLSDDDFGLVAKHLARLEFDTPVTVDANEVMKGGSANQKKNKVAGCQEWLKEFLAEYARPSAEILAEAKAQGFTFDNLKEAKTRLKADGLYNYKIGSAWWSGFGHPEDWTRQPDAGAP